MMTSGRPAEAWKRLVEPLGSTFADADDVYWKILVPRYGEPHRGYHTMAHVARCLDFLAETVSEQPSSTKLALWFHDVIYDPQRQDNEERSADVLLGTCALMGLPRNFSAEAATAVLGTKHNGVAPSNRAVQLVLDADLASLGAEPGEFQANSVGIRKEYAFVPDVLYNGTRKRILQSFLDRTRIYFTDEFHARFDAKARENLQRAIAEL